MIEKLLPLQQQQIIQRAANQIKKPQREDFLKYVEDGHPKSDHHDDDCADDKPAHHGDPA
jgi:hypothetical protein